MDVAGSIHPLNIGADPMLHLQAEARQISPPRAMH